MLAREILSNNMDKLTAVAEKLLEKEIWLLIISLMSLKDIQMLKF